MPSDVECDCPRCADRERRPAASARWGRVARFAGAIVLLGIFPVTRALADFLMRDRLPICPLRSATGRPCPLCGLTRALGLAGLGRWHEAMEQNPLFPGAAAILIMFAALLAIDGIRQSDLAGRVSGIIGACWRWWVGALAAFGAWRIFWG